MGEYLTQYDRLAAQNPMQAGAMVAGWIRADWRALFAELRAHRPVLVTPVFTLVTKFADVHEVLAHEKVFTVRPTRPQLDAALGSGFMLSRDATPLNWRERGLMQTMLAPRDVPTVRELVGRCADEILDGFAAGPIDVVQDLFRPVALRVCEEYFGYQGVPAATLSRWVRDIIKDCYANPTGDRTLHASAVASGAEMMAYLRTELGRRRACPAVDDVFGRLAALPLPDACEIDGERLAVNAAGLSLGFVESGPGAMALATRQLILRPDVLTAATRAARAEQAADFDPYVWEALRLETFFRLMPPRLCEQEYPLAAGTPRETVVKAGNVVVPALASAMYDEDVVPAPEEFRLGRPEYLHIHFGTGHHHDCLGVHLAKVIIPEAVRRLLRRGVAAAPQPEPQSHSESQPEPQSHSESQPESQSQSDIVFDAIFPDGYTLELEEAGARR